MKKESKANNKTTGINLFFKIVAMCMLIAAGILVHFEYFSGSSMPEAQVMQVSIESADPVEEENKLENKTDDMIENNHIATLISDDFKVHSSVQNKLEHYRIHLFNVTSLSKKFLQHEDYNKEIVFLLKNTNNYSDDIINLLQELKDYRDQNLTSKDTEYKKINLDDSFTKKMIGKIVDIEKKNPQYELNEAAYAKIKERLNDLTFYFYSKEFLKKYLDND